MRLDRNYEHRLAGLVNSRAAAALQGGSGGSTQSGGGTTQGGSGGSTQSGGGTTQGGSSGSSGSGGSVTGGGSGGSAGSTPDASIGGTGGSGACGGKDCLGGACLNEACQPIKIASSSAELIAPLDIAVDASHVYFTVNNYDKPGLGSIMRASIAGGQLQVLAKNLTSPYHIAIDQTWVYWTNRVEASDAGPTGTVMRIAKTAVNGTPTTLANNQPAPVGISVDDKYVYWANFVAPGGTIKRSAKDGSDSVFTLDTSLNKPWGTTCDPGTGGNVYYTVAESGYIRRVTKDGASSTDVVGIYPGARPIALDGDQLYFGLNLSAGGDIFRVSKQGAASATEMTTSSFGPVIDIAVDAQYVYFTTQLFGQFDCTGCVMRVARSGSTIAEKIWKVGSAYPSPSGIAVDGQAIYWVEYEEGSVYKIAK